jgi:hypothetical protein
VTHADKINLAGVAVTAIGSALGMLGIIWQTNGYYSFQSLQVFGQLGRLLRLCMLGKFKMARAFLGLTAVAAEKIGEDRVKALLGLYFVLIGFFLQSLGSLLLIWGILVNK